MTALELIEINNLPVLRDMYKVDWPFHISTHSTLQVFIERFKNFPDWAKKVKFFSLEDSWRKLGSFVMVRGNQIYCNTLEEFPYKSLKKTLILLELNDKVNFVNIRCGLRSLILDILRVHHFKIISDIGSKSYFVPKEQLREMTIEAPNGFELKSIGTEHAKKINDAWTGKFEGSEKFIEELLKYNPSVGSFKDGELIAWNMRMDNGSMGVGHTEPSFAGNLIGHITIMALAVKIAKELDVDVHFEIVHGNKMADKSARLATLEFIDCQTWICARSKERLELVPMWGFPVSRL